MRIDSHVYLQPDHPPDHLGAILARNRFDGAILVAESSELPPLPALVLGILIRGTALDDSLDPRIRGVCCPVADVAPAFAAELAARGLALDAEMEPGDFPALLSLSDRVPGLRIAIDHLARPLFEQGPTDEWSRGMEAAGQRPQIYCKASGLLTRVARLPWSAGPIRPFVQIALGCFGAERLMFGSEWPKRLPDIIWKESLAAFTQSIGAQTMEARERMLGETARTFYACQGKSESSAFEQS